MDMSNDGCARACTSYCMQHVISESKQEIMCHDVL